MDSDRAGRGAFVAVVVLALLAAVARPVRGDVETDLQLARARANLIAIPASTIASHVILPTAPNRQKVILFFTQQSCPPCAREVDEVFPELRKSGWQIDGDNKSHVRTIDIHDKPDCAAAYSIDSTPTFVVVDLKTTGPAKELARKTGFVSAAVIGNWFNETVSPRAKTVPKASTAVWWTTAELRAFARTYNGPMTGMARKRDSYWAHLLDHGYSRNQIQGLNETEAARIHGATHAGYLSPTHITK